MKTKNNRFFIAVFSSTVMGVSAQAPDILDLTQPRFVSGPTTSGGSGTGSAVGHSPHTVKEPSGIELRLESLDKQTYRDGESFEFRVSLLNSGGQAVTLPWEPDPQQIVTGPGAPLIEALLVVDVESAEGRFTVPIAMLYGSKMSPGNTKVLQPRGRAEVIARGSWNLVSHSSQDLPALGLPRRATVGARLTFQSNIDGKTYADLSSGNRIPIVLERRSPQ
jgi:hypothetical protein